MTSIEDVCMHFNKSTLERITLIKGGTVCFGLGGTQSEMNTYYTDYFSLYVVGAQNGNN